ncbi:MAG TPA: hypothetical protein VLG10_04625 [Methylomirabilota bacterium]|nr:hypothetical protein [Methylomirabilota bacterium]
MFDNLAVWLSAAVGISVSVFLVAAAMVAFGRFLKGRSRARA